MTARSLVLRRHNHGAGTSKLLKPQPRNSHRSWTKPAQVACAALATASHSERLKLQEQVSLDPVLP